MQPEGGLHQLLTNSAKLHSSRCAMVDSTSSQQISYGDLDRLSNRLRDRLRGMGVGPGHRVGIYLYKSISSVASIFGIIKCGAAYVPGDPLAPLQRNAYVFGDCLVSVIIIDARFADDLKTEMESKGRIPLFLVLDWDTDLSPLEVCLNRLDDDQGKAAPVATFEARPEDLAYILYTSGSTGKPKGVMLSQEHATSFLKWCSETFGPNENDRFSSHAPFHFDLSILDIYLPIKHGATLFLIGENLGKNPVGMVEMIAQERITFWYSTPSVLTVLMEHGKLAASGPYSLRTVLFAGEVFPTKHLRQLKEILLKPHFFNLYGPTETNVCTYYEIPKTIPVDRIKPYPIGTVCSHLKARVIDPEGRDVCVGDEGELIISGPCVMKGYWNLDERTRLAFHEAENDRWYRTGDIVVEGEDGIHTFVGRRDRMVKRRGYRIELGEIEAALYGHQEVLEAAALSLANDEGVTIKAFYSTHDGNVLSMIELKKFCAENLPVYMVPDLFSHQISLPKTSTDKIDYQRLKEID